MTERDEFTVAELLSLADQGMTLTDAELARIRAHREGKAMSEHEELVEKVARAIFLHWEFQRPAAMPVEWVPRGNSLKQQEARAYARTALAVVYEELKDPTDAMLVAFTADFRGPDYLPGSWAVDDAGWAKRAWRVLLSASPLNPEGGR